MNLEDIGKRIVELGAPILGAAVAGPAGATAAALIARQFNVDSSPEKIISAIEGDSNAKAHLLEIESNNRVELQRLANQREATALDFEQRKKEVEQKDRQDARSKVDPATARNLTYLLLCGLFIIIFFLFADNDIPEASREPLMLIVGFFVSEVKHVLNFYFGG